ncbi:hypothetical protein AGMMS50249_5960 [candidate division SR1 bacterium]|nr:hypothetical protein AGMMS50249_5960 [candidate division SR1 bacterium]
MAIGGVAFLGYNAFDAGKKTDTLQSDYDSKIEKLEQSIKDLEDALGTTQGGHGTRITSLENTRDALNTTVPALESAVNTVKNTTIPNLQAALEQALQDAIVDLDDQASLPALRGALETAWKNEILKLSQNGGAIHTLNGELSALQSNYDTLVATGGGLDTRITSGIQAALGTSGAIKTAIGDAFNTALDVSGSITTKINDIIGGSLTSSDPNSIKTAIGDAIAALSQPGGAIDTLDQSLTGVTNTVNNLTTVTIPAINVNITDLRAGVFDLYKLIAAQTMQIAALTAVANLPAETGESLLALPTEINGVTVAWTSNHTDIVRITDGAGGTKFAEIDRPSHADGDARVTLTAAFTYNYSYTYGSTGPTNTRISGTETDSRTIALKVLAQTAAREAVFDGATTEILTFAGGNKVTLPDGDVDIFNDAKTGAPGYRYGRVIENDDGILVLKAYQNAGDDPADVNDTIGPFFSPQQIVGDFAKGFRAYTAALTVYLDPALENLKITSAFNDKSGNYLQEAQILIRGAVGSLTVSTPYGVLQPGNSPVGNLSAGWYTVGVKYFEQDGNLWGTGFVLDERDKTKAEWTADTGFAIGAIGGPRYLWITSFSDPDYELKAKSVAVSYDNGIYVSTPFVLEANAGRIDTWAFSAGVATVVSGAGVGDVVLGYNDPRLSASFDTQTGELALKYQKMAFAVAIGLDFSVTGATVVLPQTPADLQNALNDHDGLRVILLKKGATYNMDGSVNSIDTLNTNGTQQDVVIGNDATVTLGADMPSGPSGWANFRNDVILSDLTFHVTATGASDNAALRFYNPSAKGTGGKINVRLENVTVTSVNAQEGFAYAVNASDNVNAVIEDCAFDGSTKNTVLTSIHSVVEIKNSVIGMGKWGAVSIAHSSKAVYQNDNTTVTIDAATVANLAPSAVIYLDSTDDTNYTNTITLKGAGTGGADLVLDKVNLGWQKT